MGVAALALGIISIIFAFIPGLNFVAPVIGVIGIFLAYVARKKLRQAGQPTDVATGGMVTSIIGTAFGLMFYLACMACVGGSGVVFEKMIQEAHKQGLDVQKLEEEMRRSMERAIEEGRKAQEEQNNSLEEKVEERKEPLKPGTI